MLRGSWYLSSRRFPFVHRKQLLVEGHGDIPSLYVFSHDSFQKNIHLCILSNRHWEMVKLCANVAETIVFNCWHFVIILHYFTQSQNLLVWQVQKSQAPRSPLEVPRYRLCPSRGWHASLLSFGSFYNVSPGIPLCHCLARLLKCVLKLVHSSLRRKWRQSSAFYSSFQSIPSSASCKDDIAVMQRRGWVILSAAVQAAILQVLSSRFLIQILSVARNHRW